MQLKWDKADKGKEKQEVNQYNEVQLLTCVTCVKAKPDLNQRHGNSKVTTSEGQQSNNVKTKLVNKGTKVCELS
jgi:hypothetical protein